ncbi:MAG: magnesium transporter CorA family protein [Planctomycetes bacterium]|nr:magnesium transporter CorA family protein [Planctomycetota bacterium]
MITAWLPAEKGLKKNECDAHALPEGALWIDLVDVSREEETLIESRLGIEIPTRAEMQEIEASSRLYREGATAYMTATMLIKTETEMPETAAVTFILSRERMLTLRYSEPWSFRTFAQRAPRCGATNAEQVFTTLFDTTVERLADMLELVSLELDHISQQVFRRKGPGSDLDLQRTLTKIGTCGNILGKVRESLLDKNRVLTFCEQATQDWMSPDGRSRIRALLHDIHSLADHATFTSGKISFLQDATLGLINIEQNRIIKLFSIAAVIFMPPTLVASVYGMNFGDKMPEFSWKYGYEYALGLMLVSVVGTLWFFKRQRWL